MLKFLGQVKTRTWLVLVTAVAVLERLLVYIFYAPVSYSDTASYHRLANAILTGWGQYDGTRTPGYPLFMALLGPDKHVYAAQLVFGFLTTLLFFYIGWRTTGKGWVGALAALLHTLNAQQIFFEADLLSELLTTFFVAATFAGTAWLLLSGLKRSGWLTFAVSLGTGLAAGIAAIIRPLFVFLPVWTAVCLLIVWRGRLNLRWGAVLASVLPGLILIGAWVAFIHQNFHRWGLDTMTGYHLVQHTGAFFEYVPDKYAVLRDTYLKYRAIRVAETGAPTNAIWNAIPAMQQASGIGFYDLSDLLAKISIQLILSHPLLYLKSVAQGWLWFWKVTIYWQVGQIANPTLREVASGLFLAERGGFFIANLLFIAGSLGLVWKKVRRLLGMDAFLLFTVSTIWVTSILQTLTDHGDNPRFSVPVQSLIALVVLGWGIRLIQTWFYRKEKND